MQHSSYGMLELFISTPFLGMLAMKTPDEPKKLIVGGRFIKIS
jgi:hypothetical protein